MPTAATRDNMIKINLSLEKGNENLYTIVKEYIKTEKNKKGEPKMETKTFHDHDYFSRKSYADLIRKLIIENDKFKRESATDAFVLAINAPWGSGKTQFLKQLTTTLTETGKQDIEFTVINYNAWAYNFWDNSFEVLMNKLFSAQKIKAVADKEGFYDSDYYKKLKACANAVSMGLTKNLPEGDELLAEAGINYKEVNERYIFPDLKNFTESVIAFKQMLTEYVGLNADRRRTVIMIDELDRCAPDLVLKTLEVIKHVFDIEGLTFVLAVDIQQVSTSLKTIYGRDLDTPGFLSRFFDYILNLPRPSLDMLIKKHVNESIFADEIKEGLLNHMIQVSTRFKLSPRELDTIFSNFQIFVNFNLQDCRRTNTRVNYFSLICMKYKRPDIYKKIQAGEFHTVADDPIIADCQFTKTFLELLSANVLLVDYLFRVGDRDLRLFAMDHAIGHQLVCRYRDPVTKRIFEEDFREGDSLANFFTYNDLYQWNQICEVYTNIEYIFKKLESVGSSEIDG